MFTLIIFIFLYLLIITISVIELVDLLIRAGASLEDKVTVKDGKEIRTSTFEYARDFDPQILPLLILPHSPSTHRQFPAATKRSIVWCV